MPQQFSLFWQLSVYCFSTCGCRCWVGGAVILWRHADWRYNSLSVGRSHCQYTRSTWTCWWSPTTSGLTDETSCSGESQQPCSVLHLSDVVSTDESTWSVVQSTTQRHSPVALPSPLWGHSHGHNQETHLATGWLQSMSGFFQFSARWVAGDLTVNC